MTIRVLSWNVNNASRARAVAQVALVAGESPDVVALQEVALGSVSAYRAGLTAAGLPHLVDGFTTVTDPSLFVGRRTRGTLLASRWPLEPRPAPGIPWPERVTVADVQTSAGPITAISAYVPTWIPAEPLTKIVLQEALFDLAVAHTSAGMPLVLCGDFNSPQFESADGAIVTFSQTRRRDGSFSNPRLASLQRRDQAERRFFVEARTHGITDVFRTIHGYGVTEHSWFAVNRGRPFGFRLDHIFAAGLTATHCAYLHHCRAPGLSDHAALEAWFDPLVIFTQTTDDPQ